MSEEFPFLREGMSGKTIHKLLKEVDASLDGKKVQSGSQSITEMPTRSRFFVHGMLKDLSYIYEMKQMDQQFGSGGALSFALLSFSRC